MKKIILMLTIIVLSLVLWIITRSGIHQHVIHSKLIQLESLPSTIDRTNQANQSIQSLSATQAKVTFWEKGLPFTFNAEIYYKKPCYFRLLVRSIFGKELDIGSNENVFWYWSRRDPEPGLYFAHPSDLLKTRLKTPFDPSFLRSSLGINEIQTYNCTFFESGRSVVVSRKTINSMWEPVFYKTVVDQTADRIDGFLILDSNDERVAGCQIEEREGRLPTKVVYNWYEEDRIMVLRLRDPQSNVPIDPALWELPRTKDRRIDMGRE